MGRTQVYLGERELELLALESRRTGATRSELIRRAVEKAYGGLSKEERLAIIDKTAGAWKDFPYTGAEYVDRIRGDLNERLRKLGLD